MKTSLLDPIKRHPLVAYFVLVFGIEWLLVIALASVVPSMIALLIGSWLPNAVGILVTAAAGGRPALRELFNKVILWRIPFKWYLAATLLPPAIAFLAIGIYRLSGHPMPTFASLNQLPVILLLCLFTGAMGEELGWRGTALPRMQGRWNPLVSSLILGVLWGLYHLPSFLLSGLPLEEAPLIPFMLGALGLTVLVSWTFNHTRGSLIAVFLYHFAFNFILNLTGIPGDARLFWWLGWTCIAAAAIVVLLDWKRFTQRITSAAADAWVIEDPAVLRP
jgi:membrane protease YdiL (CAAX protease family)